MGCECICTNPDAWVYRPICLQFTYVPDDSFENYIHKTNFPQASNGVVNDNYVLTSGIDFSDEPYSYISFSESNLDDPIFDLTGIENFFSVI